MSEIPDMGKPLHICSQKGPAGWQDSTFSVDNSTVGILTVSASCAVLINYSIPVLDSLTSPAHEYRYHTHSTHKTAITCNNISLNRKQPSAAAKPQSIFWLLHRMTLFPYISRCYSAVTHHDFSYYSPLLLKFTETLFYRPFPMPTLWWEHN